MRRIWAVAVATATAVPCSSAQAGAVKQALAPWAAPRMYLNFAETASPAAPLWTEQACQRLRQIKAQTDPHDLIHANHPIPPVR